MSNVVDAIVKAIRLLEANGYSVKKSRKKKGK